MDNKLPKDWKIKTLGEVCKLKNGFAFKSDNYLNEGIPVIRISDIKDGLIVPRNTVHVSENSNYDGYVINENEIIVAMSGATTGKFGIYKSKEKAYQNQRVGKFDIIDKTILDNNFLLHQLHSLKRQIEKDAYGGAQPNISSKKIEEMEIVLPPLQTQQAIVSKIEELFSELDKGIEDIKTAQQQLKTYRQSVLKWAFEGKLTNENVKDGELPKGWKIVDLKECCEVKRGKSKHRPRNAPELYGGKYPFIQTGDIRNANGGYIKRFSQTYNEIGLAQSKLWPKGTLCITIAANIGETALLDFDACFPDSVVGLLSKKDILFNKYLNYFFISFKQKLEELAPATAQKNVNVDILEKVNIPLPPIEEQNLIVQEIESRLSVADKMEESIMQSLQQAEALRQSILKKAFSGQLL